MKSIVELLKEAEEELHFQFTQDQWEDALILGFKEDFVLAKVIAIAAGVKEDRVLTPDEWHALYDRAATLIPAFHHYGKVHTRPFLANNARYANDALWDGNFAKAKRLMRAGGIRSKGRSIKKEVKLEMGRLDDVRFIKARELSKAHDWNTCK